MAASPPAPPTTVRRNPPRRARPPPTPASNPTSLPPRSAAKPKPKSLYRVLDLDEAPPPAEPAAISPIVPPPPPPAAPTATAASASLSHSQEERLKVYLRIRPLPAPDRERPKAATGGGRPAKAKEPKKPKQVGTGVCLVATGANSVELTVPQAKLDGLKRGRTEVFDGFSAVFAPESFQNDIFTEVMNPLVDEFLGGKNGLLVAMGPTGSGKTHTVFGTARNPGILPLTLQKIFEAVDGCEGRNQQARSFALSMFEILSEGKAERILDLLSDAADLVLQQSTLKGLQEVTISNSTDAEILVSRGMLKRSTAATNANSESSRSQCIITIRAMLKQSERSITSSVLTIADLAGAERKRSTGNQGSRLLESNFINNTSMVFGLCLRSLLDHQKNQKKALEKHFKNSLLTRYLRDYLEGRKKMTLILNVKPGEDDYSDTSFLLRQASPYMKIRYTSLEDSCDLVSQKRINASMIWQDNKKKRKVQKPEVLEVEGKDTVGKTNGIEVSERGSVEAKGTVDEDDTIKVSERDEFLSLELRRVSRSEEIMKKLFVSLWTVSKQYKLDSENASKSMKELIRDKDIQIMELQKELNDLKSCLLHVKFPVSQEIYVEQKDAVSSGQVALSLVSQSNHTDLGSSDAALDNQRLKLSAEKISVVQELSEESTCHSPQISSSYCDLKEGKFDDCDASISTSIDEQKLSSRNLKPEESCTQSDAFGQECDVEKGNTEITVQVVDKEFGRSDSCSEQTSAHNGGATDASSNFDRPSDRSLTEDMLPCIKSERTGLSPQFTSCSKKAPMEQNEDKEVLSKIGVEDIQHDDDKEGSNFVSWFYSQLNCDAEDVSSSQPSLEFLRKGAGQDNLEEPDRESERYEPMVEKTIEEDGCGQPPNLTNDHGSVLTCVLNERPCSTMASTAPSKEVQAEVTADKKEGLSASKPCSTKKPRRKLLPAAEMMLKEFAGPDMDADTKKTSTSGLAGRSDNLIRLLRGPTVQKARA